MGEAAKVHDSCDEAPARIRDCGALSVALRADKVT
jgi:hypothetical protein